MLDEHGRVKERWVWTAAAGSFALSLPVIWLYDSMGRQAEGIFGGVSLSIYLILRGETGSPYAMLSAKHGGGMTKDQIRGEHDRLLGLLEAYEARAVADSVPDNHAGLRQRIAGLAMKLADPNVA